MKSKSVVLGLFADRIDILLCPGDRASTTKRIPFTPAADQNAWFKSVKDAGSSLKAAIEEMDAVDGSATVLYRNPTACADYASLPITNASEAKQAAILGCADALTCSLDQAVHSAIILGRDATGSSPQTHVVVAADQDQVIGAIATMVESAGLKFNAATPIDAAIMARFGKHTLGSGRGIAGFLYVGEQRSFFIIADSGSLLFARPIGLGVDSLISSLMRPIRNAAGPEPIELSNASAKDILHRFGFPNRDAVVHTETGLTGAQIIPLLQPVLQRFIVELRQSLRFGVVEERRQDMSLTITGPGSTIPNFAGLIANELKLEIHADEAYSTFDYQVVNSPGSELTDAIEDRKALSQLELQPQSVARARHINRVRRWLWTGAAAAIVVIGMDAVQYHKRLTDARQHVSDLQSQTTDIKALQSTGEKLFAVIGAMDKLEASIAKETGEVVNMRACLHELSRLTPETVRLTNVTFNLDKGKTVSHITGHAFENQPSGGRTQLETFVEKLKSSPLFEEVVLASVQTGKVRETASQMFEISMTGVGLPRGVRAEAMASAAGGQSP